MLRGVARLPGRPHGQPLYGLRRFCRRQPRNRPSADRVRLFTRLSRGQRRAESPDRFAHPPSSPWSDDAPNPHPLIDRSPLPSCGQQPRRPPGNRSPDRPFLKRPYFPGPPFPAGQPFSPRATARRPPCAQSFPLAGSAAPNPHPLIDRSCGQQPRGHPPKNSPPHRLEIERSSPASIPGADRTRAPSPRPARGSQFLRIPPAPLIRSPPHSGSPGLSRLWKPSVRASGGGSKIRPAGAGMDTPAGCRAEKSLPFSAFRPPLLQIPPAESPRSGTACRCTPRKECAAAQKTSPGGYASAYPPPI